jgi:[acyl-carrier-protein] S-malonyltransferase
MSRKIAFLFPGQGAQSVGMARELHDHFVFVRELFDMAEEIARLRLRRLIFDGPLEELTKTVHLQPAMTVVNLACLAVLVHAGVTPDLTAGHSLGEYAALAACGTLRDADSLRLVMARGGLMQREARKHPGQMQAIVGLPIEEVEALLASLAEPQAVAVANHNSRTQIVITGVPAAVQAAARELSARGARAVPLKVSGAWHSALMKGAEEEMAALLAGTAFLKPRCPIALNVTGTLAEDPERIRTAMAAQLCSPVRWFDAMQALIAAGVTEFVEAGPGGVLAGLLRKIRPDGAASRVHGVHALKSLDAFLNALNTAA